MWNGPLGAFETPPFDAATVALAEIAAALTQDGSLVSVAGGGDTVAALNHAGVADDFTFVSTAGGAFLEWMEGATLPGVAALSNEHQVIEPIEMTDPKMRADRQRPGLYRRARPERRFDPGALKGYGVGEDACSSDEEMFALIHAMRTRIITSPCFNGDKVIGAILFERTMDGEADGQPVPQALWTRGVVPFLKVDKGLEEEADGVKLMKPMPELDALCERAVKSWHVRDQDALGDRAGQPDRHRRDRQAAVRGRGADRGHGLMPIIEPEVSIKCPSAPQCRLILLARSSKALDALPRAAGDAQADRSRPRPNLFAPLVDHPRVLRVVALVRRVQPRGGLPPAGPEPAA